MKTLIDRSLNLAAVLLASGVCGLAFSEEAVSESIAEEAERLAQLQAVEKYAELADTLNVEDFAVSIETDEHRQYWVRGGRRILSKSFVHDVYHVLGPSGDRTGLHFVLNKKDSPVFGTIPGSAIGSELSQLELGLQRLTVFELEPRYAEWYLVTAEEMRPVDAEEYVRLLLEHEVEMAGFDGWSEPLQRLIDSVNEKDYATEDEAQSEAEPTDKD